MIHLSCLSDSETINRISEVLVIENALKCLNKEMGCNSDTIYEYDKDSHYWLFVALYDSIIH